MRLPGEQSRTERGAIRQLTFRLYCVLVVRPFSIATEMEKGKFVYSIVWVLDREFCVVLRGFGRLGCGFVRLFGTRGHGGVRGLFGGFLHERLFPHTTRSSKVCEQRLTGTYSPK